MKTPSGIFIFIVVAVSLAVVSCASFCGDYLFCITIGKPGHFVPIKRNQKPAFDAALAALGDGNYDIYYKEKDTSDTVHPYHPPPRASLKTDRVTRSELAQNEPVGDPHVTQTLRSNNLGLIQNVLNTLNQ